MKNLALVILALAFVASAHAADGRRTAFVGGVVAGILGTVAVQHAVEAKPTVSRVEAAPMVVEAAPQVVYVESAPRVVYVEREPQVVYVERSPRVVYVEVAPRRVVYVEAKPRIRDFGWTAPVAHPFPQGR